MEEPDIARLAIVVEELVANLYDHGGLGPGDSFEIEFASDETAIRLTLTAPGSEFDPRQARGHEPHAGGAGAGLKLVRAWSSDFTHAYADGYNRLALTLPIGGAS